VLEEEEQTMLHKVFAFADKDAADVMVPRPDVVALSLELPVAELLRLMLQHPYTRYPVYDGELDDVVGVLHVRDLFAGLHDRGIDGVDVRRLLRPAIMVPETKRLDELLSDFRATSNHMAIVVDEYGSLAGLVTLEDLLEEIVGEIRDEYDVERELILPVSEHEAVMDARVPFSEVQETFGIDSPEGVEEFDTLGGFITHELGRLPKVGETVRSNGVKFVVESVDGRRVGRVRVIREPARTEQRA
jgi:CBS domain containing-hemolysin-like protein